MFTLQNFYRSREWERLIKQIRLQRLNERGEIICEHCGKPIVKRYDCIGHHKIFLTQENVNDVNVSLNAANIALVHHRCHNLIHNKLGFAERKVYLVYGPPLAGKSSYVEKSMMPGDLIVDIDNIWQCVSGLERYEKPPCLRSIVFSLQEELIDKIAKRAGKWHNAYIIGGYPIISERESICRTTGAEEVFIDTSSEECIKRLKDNPNGRDAAQWEKYILQWWERYTPPLAVKCNSPGDCVGVPNFHTD